MIIVRIKGGLGNQLFQYAAGYALAKRLGCKMKIDNSFYPNQTLRGYKLNRFNITFSEIVSENELKLSIRILKEKYINKLARLTNKRITTVAKEYKYLLETRPEIIDEYFKIQGNNVYIDGYYQSEQYFGEYRDELLNQLTQNYEVSDEYSIVLNDIKNCSSVAVHVRRGDFLKAQHERNPRHYLLGKEYYSNALAYMDKKIEKPIYYWFSDDIVWVKETFGEKENFRYISLNTDNPDVDEMMLMKNCKHIISANSTFSWWSAWLNENKDSIKVVPQRAYGIPGMIPDTWIRL